MLRLFFFLILLATAFLYFGNDWVVMIENSTPSAVVVEGDIEIVLNAKRLPSTGANFETYSRSMSAIGRTHVHNRLRPVIIEAYQSLHESYPQIQWVYGETGWKNGGDFWPHQTHRNGLSADFMVPVVDAQSGHSSTLALWPWNAWGYRMRFDSSGKYDSVRIDFGAVVQHLNALKLACAKNGLTIKRVIFDPPLLELLRKDKNFRIIADMAFMQGSAWFPHDSHYHVDFRLAS